MRFRLPFSSSGRLWPLISLGPILATSYGNHGEQPGWNPDDWKHILCDAKHEYWLGPDDPPFLGDQEDCPRHPGRHLHTCFRCATEGHRPPKR
jgi:hypothetical protein